MLDDFNKFKEILFGKKNSIPLTDNDLISVLLTFPSCLVAAADNEIDTDERLYLMNISESLGDKDVSNSNKARLKSAERYRAFMWLLNEREKYEEFIFSCIKKYLDIHPETKNNIKDMMWGMAEASDGVSEEEKQEIERIIKKLEINNKLN